MAFDIDQYLSTKIDPGALTDKLQIVAAASAQKVAKLQAEKEAARIQDEQNRATAAQVANSWSGRIGLEPGSFIANRVNDVASLASGASRLAGQVVSLPGNLISAGVVGDATPEDYAAYNRHVNGNATDEDRARLNETFNETSPDTKLSRFQMSEDLRRKGRSVNDFFNLESIVDPTNRNQLNKDLGAGFQSNWNKVTGSWDKATHNKFIEGSGDLISGVAGLLYNTGEAAVTNPSAVREYVVENAPQLFLGAAGRAGAAGMAASNMGYAADYYQQGIEAYQKAHGMELPPDDLRKHMATMAASLAIAEHAGDSAGLAFTKLLGKGEHVVEKGIKASLKAGAEGFATEAATEGYQTYAENDITGKATTPFDIYQGAAIGGLSGAGLSGGGHVVHQILQGSSTEQGTPEERQKKSEDFKAAAEKNDPSAYLNPEGEQYDPVRGLGVMFAHNQREDTSPEVKKENLVKAFNVQTELETKREALVEQRKTADKQEASTITAQISELDRHMNDAETIVAEIAKQVEPAPAPTEIKQMVSKVNEGTSEESTAAAGKVINLAMRNTDSLSKQDVDALIANEDNGLKPEQRDFLRTVSDARITENKLSTMKKVSQEILFGSNKNVGINQYRSRIASALAASSQPEAQRQLEQMGKFSAEHISKAQAAQEALKQGLGTQIIRLQDGTWKVAEEHLTKPALIRNAGLEINSGRLVQDIATEAEALTNAHKELSQAVGLRFQESGVQSTSSSATPQAPIATTTSSENNEGGSPNYSPQKTVKPSVRSEDKSSEPATPAPLPKEVSKDKHADERFASADKARGYITTNLLTSTHEIKRLVNGEFGVVPVNQSEKSTVSGKEKLDKAAAVEAKLNAQLAEIEAKKQAKSEVAAQPAEAVATAPAVQATTTKATEEETNPGLSLMAQKTPEGISKPYQERNLVADYFTQQAGKPDGSERPLVKAKDFITGLIKDASAALEYLKDGVLTDQQSVTLKTFGTIALDWLGTVTGNFVKRDNPAFYHRDMAQFFLNEKGEADINVATAIIYSAVSWVAENAMREQFNTDEEINAILGKDEDAQVSTEAENLLRFAGTRENVIINAVGTRIAQALGLSAQANAPRNLQPQLESQLGAHAMKLLMDQGILTRKVITGEQMKALTGSENTNANATFKFLKFNEESKEAKRILEAVKGSQGILDKVFGAESGMKMPSNTKIPYTQKSPRNTEQGVPKSLAKIMAHENAQANHLRLDMWQLMGQISEEVALAIAGFQSVNEKVTHIKNRMGIDAKNEGLRREYLRMVEYFSGMQAEDKLDAPIFFDHTVWKQQRVGIATNMINPQTSKLHRRMLSRPTWSVEVKLNDAAAVENFKLRVAEGLGVKTDKQTNAQSLVQVSAAINQPAVKAAIRVLRKAITLGGITADEQQELVAGVQAGGENMHTLDALMAMAHYLEAVKDGKDSFTTQLMSEVDGVTNGPMLSHLLLGAAESVTDLFSLLNRGGFFQQGSTYKNYNVWRAADANRDLYENTSLHMVQAIKAMQIPTRLADAIYTFTGALEKDDKVTKDGRNIIKTPLTAMVFGSSINNAISSMANNFVDSVYAKFEDVAAGKADLIHVLSQLAELGVKLPSNITVEQLMSTPLSPKQESQLRGIFTANIGEAVSSTMKEDFASFITSRSQFNTTAQLSFDLYNAAYTGLREQRVAELIKAGEIAVNATTGKPLHDLTRQQEAQLRKDVQAIMPMMHTAFSKQDGDLNAGLMSAKSGRKLTQTTSIKAADQTMDQSIDNTYGGEVKFGQPFADGTESVRTGSYTRVDKAPGVGMLVMGTHATDSFISHSGVTKTEVLNIHDAHGAGLANMQAAAQNLNQATWNAMLSYSPASEIADTLSRVMQGIAAMQESKTLPEKSQQLIAQVMAKYAAKLETPVASVLDIQMKAARDLAYKADDMKLQALEQMSAVDQYALENGQYDVTESDRAQAKMLRNQLIESLTEVDQKALDALYSMTSGVKAEAKTATPIEEDEKVTPAKKPVFSMQQKEAMGSPWGDLGAPAIESDQRLVEAFNHQPVMTAKEAIKVLRTALAGNQVTRSNDFSLQLLGMIEKTMPAGTTVQMITPKTPDTGVLDKGAEKSRGWFVAKGDAQAIYLLSPDFKYSGLTAETMLHEMVHSVLAQVVQTELDAQAKDSAHVSEITPLVKDLETLRLLAAAYIKGNKLSQHTAAIENVHELISWGMSNLDFQREVLNKLSMNSSTTENKLVTGMKRFIDILTGILFKGSNKTAQEQARNGMAVLIGNTSALFHAAAKTQSKADIILNQTNTGPGLHSYSTTDILEALGNVHTNTPVSPAFAASLKGLLTGIVDTLHGPFGTFKEALMKDSPSTPVEIYANALLTGVAPFASQSLAAGFRVTDQEAYVMEQVEATVRAALQANDGHTTAAYQELAKLYKEVSAKLKPQDFHDGDWNIATAQEKDEAQRLHDFVIKLEANSDKRSEYLARFAALGLAHERTANLLGFATDIRTDRQLAGLSFSEKLHKIYDMVLSWFNGQFTHTYEGQQADAKLESLVTTLVGIEARKVMKLNQQRNQTVENLESNLKDLTMGARKKIDEFAKSPFFKQSTNTFLRAGAGLVSTIAGDRVDIMMDGINRIRDEHFRKSHGLMAGIINEIRGSNVTNLIFHKLLRVSKHIEGMRKDIITNVSKFTMESFKDGGNYITKEMKAGISQVLLRSDATSLLGTYSLADVSKMIQDPAYLKQETKRLENQLAAVQNFGHYFIKSAKMLGMYKATGRVVGPNIMFSAGNIANLYGTNYAGKVSPAVVTKAEPMIDMLTTMYALAYVSPEHLAQTREVLKVENARTDGNGIEMILKLHAKLQQDSKDRLFASGEPLRMKGYVPEAYNPYVEIKVANAVEGEKLIKQGFVKHAALVQDIADVDQEARDIYVLRDGGLQSHLTGIMSYTGMRAKGSEIHNGNLNLLSQAGITNQSTMGTIASRKQAQIRDMFNADPTFDPRKVGGTHLAPVLNATGDVVNYRYMMQESTKDTLLERDNRFDQLLGSMAGNIFDKEMTVEQNARGIEALKAQYDLEFAEKSHSYLTVGPKSTDPELREIWQLLPESTKQTIREVWGGNDMKVRVDLLDINFGYRKLSIADTFTKDAAQRNGIERVLYEVGTFFFDEKARLRFKQGEDIWQALVREAKDTMVVKSGVTLLGNISSNLTELMWFGVPMKDILYHHRVAMKGALSYRKDSEALARIDLQLSTGYMPAATVRDLERQKLILEDALARNPVGKMIDAGLMPTIVEDVAADDDMYSFKGRLTRKVEEFTDRLNPHVVDTAKTLMIAHDTPLYKALSYGTQLSDFVARYTLYQHMTTRAKNPMASEATIQLVSDAFINYDVPSHRVLQYMNDTGMVYFTKYYLRIQKTITHLYRENPGRAMMLLAGSHFFHAVPTLMDAAFVHRMGNPFSMGALKAITTLDETATINALMTPFK